MDAVDVDPPNAVPPPLEFVFAVPPGVPVDLSQVLNVILAVPLKLGSGTNFIL